MATSDKLNKLLKTKEAIRHAIGKKGVEVADDEPFANYPNKISEISGGSNDDFLALRTNNHTNYKSLFESYTGDSLDEFGIESWDTSNVTVMTHMFASCRVKDYNLSNWDFSKVTDTANMFSYSKAVKIDLSSWTVNPEISYYNAGQMFAGCYDLETLDIRNLNITDCNSNPTIVNMFQQCRTLHTLRLDNCPNDTINKIITSTGFPTGTIVDGMGDEILDSEGNTIIRKIYCKQAEAEGLTPPDGWAFEIIDAEPEIPEEPEEPEVPDNGIPLYVPGEFYNNREITEVTTMVTSEHDDLESMFCSCTSLQTINGIEDWDTSNVNNMNNMFRSCDILETLDVSSFNTSNVDNMSEMFAHCHQLRTLEGLSNFDTSNVNNMSRMFECCCENLEYLDLSNFDMSNVWETENMFDRCRKLKEIRLDNCSRDTIEKITGSSNFPMILVDGEKRKLYITESEAPDYVPIDWEFVNKDTDEVIERPEDIIYKRGQFEGNRDMAEVTTMVTSEHDDLGSMFERCGNLQIINGIEDWDTSNVGFMGSMFSECERLESLNVSSFNTRNVDNMERMFNRCLSLITLDLSSFDTGNVHNMKEMFKECENLESLDLSNFDMSNTWDTNEMFQDCHNLRTLRLDNCNHDTIEKIITSFGFPTDDIGVTRTIYCQEANAEGLTAPENWVFSYVN